MTAIESPCKQYIQTRRKEVEETLLTLLPKADGHAAKLCEAMRYSLEAGGKRIRPVLVLIGADFCRGVKTTDSYENRYWDGVDDELRQAIIKVACSIELIHTYSLIHDDLPCMDDDDLRRGRPTSHVVYGEALAVLSADALHTLGFEWISGLPEQYAKQAMKVAYELASACGYDGMVAGQVVDLEYESKKGDREILEYIHMNKTAALIRASLLMGACMVGASKEDYQTLSQVGTKLGLIFQVVDDVLDVVGDTELMGKNTGMDESHEKLTYPALIGLEKSKELVTQLKNDIESLLENEQERAGVLLDITQELVDRNN